MPDWLEQLLGGAGAAAGLGLAAKAYSDLGDIGERAYQELAGEEGLASEIAGMTEFRPFTVTSATGGRFGMTQDPTTGQMTYQLETSPEEQAFQRRLFEQAGQFYEQAAMPTTEREQQVFDRMQLAMAPQQERERLALEERLAAQGRLGVRTAQFGGTGEQLALAKAQEEARNTAMLSAMQQAQREQLQQAQLGSGMLASGYVPQAQLLGALQPGMTASERQRQSQLFGAGQYGETTASGLDALLAAGLGQADIAASVGSGLLSQSLGSLFG